MGELESSPSRERLADVVARCGPTAALAIDAAGRILFVNEALERVLGHDASALMGRDVGEFLHPDDRDDLARRGILGAGRSRPRGVHGRADATGPEAGSRPSTPEPPPGPVPPARSDPAPAPTAASIDRPPAVLRVRDGAGAWRWVEATTTPLGAGAEPRGTILHLYDVTLWRRREAALSEQVLHDPLTGAASRTLFEDRLGQAMLRGPRSGPPRVAVLFCDLDGFKDVNDTLGHAAGDALLVEAFTRLRRAVRPPDTVARLGGDEFVVCCEDVDGADAPALARRIRRELRAPFRVHGRTVRISASIGIALARSADQSVDDLVRDADRAMYSAKSRGPDRIVVHDDVLRAELSALDATADALRGAVEHGGLELRWLPRVHLRRRRVVGSDAFVWWRHPDRGPVPAAGFRNAATRAGLDGAIVDWALTNACRQFAARADGRARNAGRVWVELGPGRLGPELVPTVRRALASVGLPARRLGLGVAGTDLAGLGRATGRPRRGDPAPAGSRSGPDAVRRGAALGALGRLGVHLSVDDLPGDPAALGVLRRGSVRIVSVPPSIVDGLGRRTEHTAVARGLVSMAHSLEIRTHAAGVTTPAQAHALEELGCDTASGPLFSALAAP